MAKASAEKYSKALRRASELKNYTDSQLLSELKRRGFITTYMGDIYVKSKHL